MSHDNEGYIIEFRKVGRLVKVSAVDPVTSVEVSIAIPTHGVSRLDAKRIAIRKLEYVLDKQQHDTEKQVSDSDEDGLIV